MRHCPFVQPSVCSFPVVFFQWRFTKVSPAGHWSSVMPMCCATRDIEKRKSMKRTENNGKREGKERDGEEGRQGGKHADASRRQLLAESLMLELSPTLMVVLDFAHARHQSLYFCSCVRPSVRPSVRERESARARALARHAPGTFDMKLLGTSDCLPVSPRERNPKNAWLRRNECPEATRRVRVARRILLFMPMPRMRARRRNL